MSKGQSKDTVETMDSERSLLIAHYLYIQVSWIPSFTLLVSLLFLIWLFPGSQMEYCEKSTLRDTIDHGLYQDQNRLWRLFREILDGLAYIHQQVSDYTRLYTCRTAV